MSPVKAVPDGYHTITPHLVVKNAKAAIDYYQKAFGAQLAGDIAYDPSGRVMHAVMKIGDSVFMLNDEFPEAGVHAPSGAQGTGVTIHVYLPNVDETFAKATAAGGEAKMPVMDMFWGDRYGVLNDPYGHRWSLATHTKDMTADEMKQAMQEAMRAMKKTA